MHVGPAISRHVRTRHGWPWRYDTGAAAVAAVALSLRSQHRLSACRANLFSPSLVLAQTTPRIPSAIAPISSSSSSSRWKARQSNDAATRAAKLAGLKSRAAFKLLEIHSTYRIFRPGDTVVDLGFAPGSWSQVAAARTAPNGRVVGIDVLPAQPPKGVSTLQGDFLSGEIQAELRRFVRDPAKGRPRVVGARNVIAEEDGLEETEAVNGNSGDASRSEENGAMRGTKRNGSEAATVATQAQRDLLDGRVVNVVLSDMSAPWSPAPTASMWLRSVSNPYRRMMNTSGISFRDHAGSMDLCYAALTFAYDTLVTGGHFLCKFYDGAEAHALELRLKKLFDKVHRIKPDASRKESKEAYFVGLRRKPNVERDLVLGGGDR